MSKLELRRIPVSPNDNYRAGNDGRIYSRTRYAGFGKKVCVDWYPLIGHKNGKGYQTISMCHENRKVTKSIHKLICLAFHGTPPSPAYQVRHLDGNKKNNRPKNLTWGTPEENWADRKAHGHGIEGEKHHNAKLKNVERAALKWALAKGLCSQRHAARMLGMSQASIYAVAHSK